LQTTREFLAIFSKKSTDFFSDFLGKNRFLEKIAISRDFADFYSKVRVALLFPQYDLISYFGVLLRAKFLLGF
jgi:hypothetical protein